MVALVVFVRRSAGRSGATKVQIAERRGGRNYILEHVGTARSEGEPAVLTLDEFEGPNEEIAVYAYQASSH